MHMKVLFLSLGFWSLTAGAALATTYCAVLPWGKSCGFKSYEECHRAAGNDGGCEFSPEPDQPPPANAPYCLVDQVGMQCIYESAPACSPR